MSLSAIMPLTIKGSYNFDDLTRSEILFKTLTAFTSINFFEKFYVVVPEHEVAIVRRFYGNYWWNLNLEVISELDLVPEFENHQNVRGWRKQQIIKLAAPRIVQSDFFMTFDADVICLKPLNLTQLIVNGKALVQYEKRSLHPKWWRSSSRLLKMNQNVGDPKVGMSITPCVMSNVLTRSVTSELAKLENKNWVEALCSLHNPKRPENWSLERYLKNKWTEYSLYYLNAHKQGLFEQYHTIAGTDANPQLLMVHDSHPFENWHPAYNFSSQCRGMFCVVGSKSGLDPKVVWDKVKPFVPSFEQAIAS